MKVIDATNFAGSKPKLCALLGLSRMSVSHWGYWVPEKHAITISKMEGCKLKVDKDLYSGKKTIEVNGKIYTPAINIKSTNMLGKSSASGEKLYFIVEGGIIPIARAEGDIYKNFRIYPMYAEVK